jgi:hypothetical protein
MVLGAPHLAEAPMVNHRQHDRVEWREVVAARSDDGATGEQQRQPLSRHHVSKRIEMIVLKHRPSGSGSAGYRPPPADPPEAADLPEKKCPADTEVTGRARHSKQIESTFSAARSQHEPLAGSRFSKCQEGRRERPLRRAQVGPSYLHK